MAPDAFSGIAEAISIAAPQAHIAVDAAGVIVYANRSAAALFVHPHEKLLGMKVERLIPPEQLAAYARHAQEYLSYKQGGRPEKRGHIRFPVDAYAMRGSGEVFPVSLHINEVVIGGTRLFAGIIEDVTARKGGERLLKDTIARYNAIMQASDETIALVRKDGVLLAINDTGAARLGHNAAAITGRNLADLLPPEVWEKRKPYFETVYRTRQPLTFDDERAGFHFSSSLYPVMGEEGQVAATALFARDITARKRAEESVRDREERMQAILSYSPNAVITINARGVVETYNAAAERTFGHAAADVVGRNINVLMPAPYRQEHDGYMERYLRTGHKNILGKWREVTAERKDGSTFPAEIFVNEIWLKDERLFLGVVRDITERKAAEESIRAANRKYGTLINNISIVVYALGPDGRMTFFSREAERLTGYAPHDLLEGNNSWDALVLNEDREAYDAFRRRLLENVEKDRFTYRVRGRAGEVIWVEDICTPIMNEIGEVFFQGTVENITRLKELERIREDFFQTIVHDLKSPITGIKLELESLAADIVACSARCCASETAGAVAVGDAGRFTNRIENIGQGLDQIYLMVMSLLKIGQIEEEKLELQYEPFEMKDLLEESVRPFRSRLALKNLTLEVRNLVSGSLLSDRTLLARVLQNLIDNALKYSHPDTAITLDAVWSAGGGGVIVSVTNSGVPFTEAKVNALFTKLRTLDNPEGGSGIGLFFCSKAMKLLEGGIYADQDGGKITFHIFFPNG